MFLLVGLVLILTLTPSVTNGEKSVYPILNMTDAVPYEKIPCSDSCLKSMDTGLEYLSVIFETILKSISFPVDFCQKCVIEGAHGFTFTHKCFMSPDGDVFDHHLALTMPHLVVKCKCDLSNSPNVTATKINEGKVVGGQCGFENYKNDHTCRPMKCAGSQGGDGQESHVTLSANLKNAVLPVVLRIDPRENPVTHKAGAFAIRFAVTTNHPVVISHDGPPEFNDAWKCLAEDMDGFICHLFANAVTPFYECLTPGDKINIVHSLLYLFGKC